MRYGTARRKPYTLNPTYEFDDIMSKLLMNNRLLLLMLMLMMLKMIIVTDNDDGDDDVDDVDNDWVASGVINEEEDFDVDTDEGYVVVNVGG